ncbi:hypothetical protein BB560_003860, partial [Smittium megazygosporum]
MSLDNSVKILNDQVLDVSNTDHPLTIPGSTNFSIQQSIKNLKIKIIRVSPLEMEFDLIGVDASFANALRRILISEVPTMAIEKVYMLNNTGVVQDEVLAHRLGLIPIKADPRYFSWKDSTDDPTDQNTIVFKLDVACSYAPKNYSPEDHIPQPSTASDSLNDAFSSFKNTRTESASQIQSKVSNLRNLQNLQKSEKSEKSESLKSTPKYINSEIYSGMLVWDPKGDQIERFSAENAIRPVYNDILITKLRPGQKIQCELHCIKGIGRDHAKFSPVATASYKLLPKIDLLAEITGNDAYKLQQCFSPGVVEVSMSN